MITGSITNGESVIRRVEAFPTRIGQKLVNVITRLTIDLQAHIIADKLSGQVLKNRTGTLRSSIRHKVDVTPNSVIGQVGVGPNASSYGRVHEYGFSGTVVCRTFQRMQSQAFGQPITPRLVTVRAHSRQANYPERSFLRSALEDMRPEILAKIEAVLNGG